MHGSDSRDEITHRTILTAKNLYNKCSTYHCFLRRHTAGKASCLSPLSTSKLPYLVRASCTSALDIASTQDDSHLCCHSDYPLSTKRAQTTGRQSFKVLLKLFCNSCMLFVGNELPLASQLSQDQPGWTVLELWKHYLTMTVQAALVTTCDKYQGFGTSFRNQQQKYCDQSRSVQACSPDTSCFL